MQKVNKKEEEEEDKMRSCVQYVPRPYKWGLTRDPNIRK
jgi:hypothetical protein